MFERMKRKETKNEKRNTVKHKEVGNIEEIVFMVFVYISKTSCHLWQLLPHQVEAISKKNLSRI